MGDYGDFEPPQEWFNDDASTIIDAQERFVPVAPHEAVPEPLRIEAKPFQWRDPAELPPRQWLYGTHLIRKFLSLDIAAGGIGKSSIKIVEALAITSGRDLLGKEVHEGPLRVWHYNLEDPDEETERRIHAALIRYDLTPEDIGDRLYVNSGRDQPLIIAEETKDGARIMRPFVDALVDQIREREIDVMQVDPFVSSHQVSENDNRAIDMVAKEWSRIADICNCSINLVHHVRKSNGTEVSAESSRGAVSLIGAARSVIVYNRMTKEEGESAGIEPTQRGFYFRTQNDKANLAPPEAADWHRMNNVDLPNGDKVGVACPWKWPDAFDGVSVKDLYRVQMMVDKGNYRENVQARDWAGYAVAEVMGLDAGDPTSKARIKALLRGWKATESLVVEMRVDPKKREEKPFLAVGKWVDPTAFDGSTGGQNE